MSMRERKSSGPEIPLTFKQICGQEVRHGWRCETLFRWDLQSKQSQYYQQEIRLAAQGEYCEQHHRTGDFFSEIDLL